MAIYKVTYREWRENWLQLDKGFIETKTATFDSPEARASFVVELYANPNFQDVISYQDRKNGKPYDPAPKTRVAGEAEFGAWYLDTDGTERSVSYPTQIEVEKYMVEVAGTGRVYAILGSWSIG